MRFFKLLISLAALSLSLSSLAQVPVCSLQGLGDTPIGEAVNFQVSFDNTDAVNPGFGPYIDLILPLDGADGAANTDIQDGVDFISAHYLGASLNVVEQVFPAAPGNQLDHPFLVDATNTPVVITGPTGYKLVTIELPFGSFTSDQPAASVDVAASMSNLADLGTALNVDAQCSFRYGADALSNPGADPSIVGASTSASVTPTLISLDKVYIGPENETATGPNFLRSYTINVDIADGQTVTDLDVSDFIPDNMVYTQVLSSSPASTTVLEPLTTGASGPGLNELRVNFASVTGGTGASDASVTFEYFIPLQDAFSVDVIDPVSGDDVFSENQAQATGDWIPIDTRDIGGTDNATARTSGSELSTPEHVLTDKSIAIQKSVSIFSDVGVAGASPGDTLEYSLQFQVSDYFALENLIVTDTFTDGQRWDGSFLPTLSVTEHGSTSSNVLDIGTGLFVNDGNVFVDESQIGNDLNPITDGSTTITFDVSDELITRALDGVLHGGGVQQGGIQGVYTLDDFLTAFNAGATSGVITFRTVIQDAYTDDYPSTNPHLNERDSLSNVVSIDSAVLSRDDTTLATGFFESDGSAASVTIQEGSFTKSIYAIDGNTAFANSRVAAGQTVTYRVQYNLAIGEFENFLITDYLPLPVFFESEVTTFNAVVDASVPSAGTAKFGPNDSTFAQTGITPSLGHDAVSNALSFDFGTYESAANNPLVIDILFTVTASDEPFADGLFLTNQARQSDQNTESVPAVIDDIVQIELTEPVLDITKGVVATDHSTGNFAPATVGPVAFTAPGSAGTRWSGTINTAGLLASPIDSDLGFVEGGSLVTFAIVVENIGSGLTGAYDVIVQDLPPASRDMAIPVGGLNLQVRDGAGNLLAHNDPGDGSALFGPGLELTDGADGAIGPGEIDGSTVTDGLNILVITYDLEVLSSAEIDTTLTNTASLINYANTEGGTDFTTVDLTDEASVTLMDVSSLLKTTVNTSEVHTTGADLAIGEVVRYQLSFVLPQGQASDLQLRDRLPSGLLYLDDGTAQAALVSDSGMVSTAPSGDSLGLALGVAANQVGNAVLTPAFTLADVNSGSSNSLSADPDSYASGTDVYFKLGDVQNNDADADNEYVVIEFNALVLNESANQNGTNLDNDFQVYIANTVKATSNDESVVVREPDVSLSKTFTPTTGLDAGNAVQINLVFQNIGSASAFDVNLLDVMPTGLDLTGISSVTPVGGASGATDNSNVATETIDVDIANMPVGSQVTVIANANLTHVVQPSEMIVNTANVGWTSLPGGQGTTGNVTGSDTPGGTGSGTGERNDTDGSGGLNDYVDSNDASLTVNAPVLGKFLIETSESHTLLNDLAIGEIARYRLVAEFPEGSSPNLQIVDRLPSGLLYLDDNKTRVALISDTGMDSNEPAGALTLALGTSANIAGNAQLAPVFLLPAANIGSSNSVDTDANAFTSGADIYFKLGDVVNNDSDGDWEYVVIDFNALVLNEAANQNASILDNDFIVTIAGSQNGLASNQITTIVREPLINNVDKAVFQESGRSTTLVTGDAGDTAYYRVTYSNTGAATAFDVNLLDVLPASATLNLGSIVLTPAGGLAGVVDNSAGNSVDIQIDIMPVGGSITVDYEAVLVETVNPEQQISNTADVTYTALPANGTATNPTGVTTPGGSGAADGERNGSGGVNDYADSDTVSVNVDIPIAQKVLQSTDEVTTASNNLAIGEQAVFDITVTIPEGDTTGIVITDTLPYTNGVMEYVSWEVLRIGTNVFAGSCVSPEAFGDAAAIKAVTPNTCPTVNVSDTQLSDGILDTISFDLGATSNNSDNTVTDDDRVFLRVTAEVVDLPVNVEGDTLTNSVLVEYGGTLTASATADVNLVEPQLNIVKSGSITNGDAGDLVTYSMTVTHTGASSQHALDVVLTDIIPADMTYVGASLVTTACTDVPEILDDSANPTLSVNWDQFDLGASCTIEFQVTLDNTVVPGTDEINTAGLAWDSLSTDITPDGEDREYTDSDNHTIRITEGSLAKTVTATSETHTGNGGDAEEDLTIGETVTYEIRYTFPEGTTPGVVLTDQLPTGTVSMAIESTRIISIGDKLSFTPATINVGDAAALSDGLDTDSHSDQAQWDLGEVLAVPTGTSSEMVFEVIARVMDETINQGSGGGIADQVNTASMTQSSGTPPTDATALVDIVEPELSIIKARQTAEFVDAGDIVGFQITLGHTANSSADAQNLLITDDLGTGFVWSGNFSSSCGAGLDTSGDPIIVFDVSDLPLGNSCTIDYEVQVAATVNPGSSYSNSALLEYDTLDGGELPGEGGDDANREQTTSDSDSVTIDAPGLVKVVTTTSNADTTTGQHDISIDDLTIGEEVTYTLTATFPEGISTNVVLVDDLPTSNGVIEVIGASIQTIGVDLSATSSTINETDVNLVDSINDRVEFVLGDVTNTPDGDTDDGDRIVFTVQGRVVNVLANADADLLVNNATLSYDTGPDLTDTADVELIEPVLNMTKTMGPIVDGVVTMDISITNSGSAPAYDVTFEDVLSNTEWQTGSIVQTSISPGFTLNQIPGAGNVTVQVSGASLAVGASAAVQFTVPVIPGVLTVNNNAENTQGDTVSGSSNPEDRDVSGDIDSDSLNFPLLNALKSGALLIDADGSSSISAADRLRYTITLNNTGPGIANNVLLIDTPDANSALVVGSVTTSSGSVITGNTGGDTSISVNVASIAASGGSVTITYDTLVNNPLPAGVTELVNQGTVSSDEQPDFPTDDPTPPGGDDPTVLPVEAAPDLAIVKDDGGVTTTPGGLVSYTLDYSNVGTQDATGVEVTETVPAETSFNAASSTAGWTCLPNNSAGSTCTINIGNLDVGDNGSLNFALDVNPTLPAGFEFVSNTSSIADDGSNGPDENPIDNEDSDTTPINAAPDLTINKDDGGITSRTGSTVVYSIQYQNVGNQDATGVVITETIPTGSTFDAASSDAGWSCVDNAPAGSNCQLIIGALAAAASGSSAFAVTVDDVLPAGLDELLNQISIADDGSNGPDPTPDNNSDDEATPLSDTPDLYITKDDGDLVSGEGQVIPYTLNYGNQGTQDATGVVINEVVPAHTLFNAAGSTPGWSCADASPAPTACQFSVGNLAVGETGTVTFAVRVEDPLATGIESVINTVLIADDGSNGPEPTPDDNSDEEDTPVILYPPTGHKTVDSTQLNVDNTVEWVIWWFNGSNEVDLNSFLFDVMPEDTTYVDGSLSCEADGSSVCNSAAFNDVENRIEVDAIIAPDYGAVVDSAREDLSNEVVIRFRTVMPLGNFELENQAQAHWDENNDGDPSDDESGGQTPEDSNDPRTDLAGDPTAVSRAIAVPGLSQWSVWILVTLILLMAYSSRRNPALLRK